MSRGRQWTEVVPGFFSISVADVNCYLVQTADGLTLFDAGLPRSRGVLRDLLGHLAAKETDIDAVVLTHGHFDHVGVACGLHEEGVSVFVHPRDAHLARHPYSYRPASPRVPYVLTHPRGIPTITRMALAGALNVRGVEAQPRVRHEHPIDTPGTPIALWTPGHTEGHCAYLFEESGVLIAGDARPVHRRDRAPDRRQGGHGRHHGGDGVAGHPGTDERASRPDGPRRTRAGRRGARGRRRPATRTPLTPHLSRAASPRCSRPPRTPGASRTRRIRSGPSTR
ncbi:MBL fold metallo-hydrolase [Microbacterium sp. NPDC078814]|uniref:MBL fold metallo-hydrolase n=1 Tax=Microbacterium sp. NPDC078814 TaxID=3154767 RepID=UPI00344F0367